MICKTCDRQVPDTMVTLECAECTYKRLNEGVDEHQLDYLRMVHEGRYPLIIHTVLRSGIHIQKFGVRMTFCGKVIVPIPKYKKYAPYGEEELAKVCPKCAEAVRAAMAEALAPASDVVVSKEGER